jgi:predicted phosphodiesterase
MRIRVLSDLHLEFRPLELPVVSADVVVLAGDTAPGTMGVRWAREQFPRTPVVYVAGNHEAYGHSLPGLYELLRREAAGSAVHVLEEEALELDGVEFLGCTLWTDQALFGDPEATGGLLEAGMNDYHMVWSTARGERWTAADARAAHARNRAWLEQRFATPPGRARVVVTHHAPSPRSLPDKLLRRVRDEGWQGKAGGRLLLHAGYTSRLDPLVEASGAALWIHGHIHTPVDYRLGGTRVLSNPHGYGSGPGVGFRHDLVIDV